MASSHALFATPAADGVALSDPTPATADASTNVVDAESAPAVSDTGSALTMPVSGNGTPDISTASNEAAPVSSNQLAVPLETLIGRSRCGILAFTTATTVAGHAEYDNDTPIAPILLRARSTHTQSRIRRFQVDQEGNLVHSGEVETDHHQVEWRPITRDGFNEFFRNVSRRTSWS